MAYDIQVLVQAVLYFIIFVMGFAVSIPLGVTVIEFDDHCILYTDFNWHNATYATYELTSSSVCKFPVFYPVFVCIFYGLAMGIYNLYAVCKSNDPNVGFQMWVMPFLLSNTLILIGMFIICCIISVGLKDLCDDIMDGKAMGAHISTCSDAVKFDWNKLRHTDYTYKHFYTYPKASEVAGWFTFLAWVIQTGLCVVRVIRNRRQRSKDMAPVDTVSTAGGNKSEDLENFASVQPSA